MPMLDNSQESLSPKEIVEALDRYVVGQKKAKKAVAIALRNRIRRKKVPKELRDEILPKNIMMIGSTGVGKTEIARRLAYLDEAPFIKVEATKFTEVGYVGRDVDSIIRDLVNIAINKEKEALKKKVEKEAEKTTEEILLDLLITPPKGKSVVSSLSQEDAASSYEKTRSKIRQMLRDGVFENKIIEIEINQNLSNRKMMEFSSEQGFEQIDSLLQNLMQQFKTKKNKRKLKVKQARKIIKEQAVEKLIDMDKIIEIAILKTEQNGIVFLDEIDKIVSGTQAQSAQVSREGVQRDLLPLIEGSSVNTRYGIIKTDHILFIAAGAFHVSSPSDMIPELQGRFPIRVELNPLSVKDLEKILSSPKNALIKQYQALLKTEGIHLEFSSEAIKKIATIAADVNQSSPNIGARRLTTIMEKLLEDILFSAPDIENKKISIDLTYVKKYMDPLIESKDLTKYIL